MPVERSSNVQRFHRSQDPVTASGSGYEAAGCKRFEVLQLLSAPETRDAAKKSKKFRLADAAHIKRQLFLDYERYWIKIYLFVVVLTPSS